MKRDVVITGYGLLCPLGETPDERWAALNDGAALAGAVDSDTFKPFHVYPIGEYDLSAQVPKPGDQRAMGPMMQYGAYAAGLALDMASVKGEEELLQRVHLIAAAPGGERDWELDEQILGQLDKANDRDSFLNEQLSDGLRPTLFLAQLPNLFAGNISIIFGVSGSSRTFMGEEMAGADAVRIAHRRIEADQGDIFLVGAAYNAERPDVLQVYHAGGMLLMEPMTGLWRRPEAGMCLGSAGAFLVMEARESADRRGAEPLAVVRAVECGRAARAPGSAAATAKEQFDRISPALDGETALLLSGATGAGAITAEERQFITTLGEGGHSFAVRGTAQAFGNAVEASFLQNVIVGLESLKRGNVFSPLVDDPLEECVQSADVRQTLITGWGHARGEAMALLERADG